MASPRFIGVRDVVDPYKGLQDSVAKAGDIYRQYNKDVQEAQRIRNEEARQNERLAMDRTTHQQQQEKFAEEQRRNAAIRGFDPESQIENYGIPDRFIPEISRQEQQVRDYYSRAPLIAAGSGAEGAQARQQVEESLRIPRTEAFDAATAQRQGLQHLIRQGVPASEAVAIVQAQTLGKRSLAERETAMTAQAKAEDDRAMKLAEIQGNLLGRAISANRVSVTGGTSGSKSGSTSTGVEKENFSDLGIAPADIAKAKKEYGEVLGRGMGWTGNPTKAVNYIRDAVTTANEKRLEHNKQVTLGEKAGELLPLIPFNDAVGWVGSTAEIGGNVSPRNFGEMLTFIEDTASRRDFSNAANRVREQENKAESASRSGTSRSVLTGADVQSIMPQRMPVPPIDDTVRSNLTASYSKLFPEVFPTPTRAATPIDRPSGGPAGREVNTRTGSGTNDRDISPPASGGESNTTGVEPNIIGGTRSIVQASEQPQQTISRDVLVPFSQPKTSIEADINGAVTRMAEIQSSLADPNLSNRRKRELYEEAEVVRDSLRQLPDSDRVLEAIRANARQAQLESTQVQAQAREEQSRRELTTREVQQIRERLAGNVSPTVRRINEDRLQQLLQAYPDLEESTPVSTRSGLSTLEQLRQDYYERYPDRIP